VESSADAETKERLTVGLFLHDAAAHNEVSRVLELLDRGVDHTAWDECGATALHIAAGAGHLETVMALMCTESIDAVDDEGATALVVAAGNGSTDVVRYLLDAGVPLIHQKG